MSTAPRERRLSDLVEQDAPLASSRALAVMVAVTREVAARDAEAPLGAIPATAVHLGEDGSVRLDAAQIVLADDAEPEAGPSLGRLLFALLVGRAPVDRSDGFEPAVRAAVPSTTCALIARSCSTSPGQWPTVEEWSAELDVVAAGQAPALAPAERRRRRRRTVLLAVAFAALVVASVLALWLAPRWWDDATAASAMGPEAPTQVERASS